MANNVIDLLCRRAARCVGTKINRQGRCHWRVLFYNEMRRWRRRQMQISEKGEDDHGD